LEKGRIHPWGYQGVDLQDSSKHHRGVEYHLVYSNQSCSKARHGHKRFAVGKDE